MSRVITFSRFFPAYHPKAGQPTFFVEKIYNAIHVKYWGSSDVLNYWTLNELNEKICTGSLIKLFHENLNPEIQDVKHHTIRKGNRWKVGDKFSPRVWSGKPYRSRMITIAQDIEIKKAWNFKINRGGFYINERLYDGEIESHHELLEILSMNDGLSSYDLLKWFQYPKEFKGQIICWNESIEY